MLEQLIHLFHNLLDIGLRGAEVGDAGAQHGDSVDAGLGHPGDLPPVQRGKKGRRVEMLTRKADERQRRFIDYLPAGGRQRLRKTLPSRAWCSIMAAYPDSPRLARAKNSLSPMKRRDHCAEFVSGSKTGPDCLPDTYVTSA